MVATCVDSGACDNTGAGAAVGAMGWAGGGGAAGCNVLEAEPCRVTFPVAYWRGAGAVKA